MKKRKSNKNQLSFVILAGVVILAIFLILFFKKEMTVCELSVKEYLATADFKGEGQEVKKGDDVIVDYIGRLDDGTVFDTSLEAVARGCESYNEGRDYTQGLRFVVGAGQMIAGFDRGVEGMKVGQTKTIEIEPIDAYGEWDESRVLMVEKSKLDLSGQYNEGDLLYGPNGEMVKVYKVTEEEIYLDTNHNLAGKTLIFDITVKEVK